MAVVIKGSGSIEGSTGLEMGANGTTEIRGQVNVAVGSSVAGVSTATQFVPTTQQTGHRNMLINGACLIDQRNGGSSVTSGYAVDRTHIEGFSGGGAGTGQQVSDAPSGFLSSLKITVTTADGTLAAGDYYTLRQIIEGRNVTHLGFGAAGASDVTLSFWVKGSVTGTYSVALSNGSNNRGMSKEYTISSAGTWEYKTITFAGDTTGTWGTDTGRGFSVRWSMGVGSTRQATAGSWSASEVHGSSNQTNMFATNGATFQITGLQLEAGSQATPFEHQNYADELSRCYRYYYLHGPNDNSITYSIVGTGMIGQNGSTTTGKVLIYLPVVMRTKPSVSVDVGSNEFKNDAGGTTADSTFGAIWSDASHNQAVWCDFAGGSSSNGTACMVYKRGSGGGILGFSSEM